MLTENLGMDEAVIRKKVEKVSSRELIRSNVDKETGDRIRAFHYEGVKVDEDYKRYYPLGELASKVLGFTGSDNQGIIGLEVAYESYLKGTAGQIRTLTDARGVEIENAAEARTEPVPGYDPVRQPGQQHPGPTLSRRQRRSWKKNRQNGCRCCS